MILSIYIYIYGWYINLHVTDTNKKSSLILSMSLSGRVRLEKWWDLWRVLWENWRGNSINRSSSCMLLKCQIEICPDCSITKMEHDQFSFTGQIFGIGPFWETFVGKRLPETKFKIYIGIIETICTNKFLYRVLVRFGSLRCQEFGNYN